MEVCVVQAERIKISALAQNWWWILLRVTTFRPRRTKMWKEFWIHLRYFNRSSDHLKFNFKCSTQSLFKAHLSALGSSYCKAKQGWLGSVSLHLELWECCGMTLDWLAHFSLHRVQLHGPNHTVLLKLRFQMINNGLFSLLHFVTSSHESITCHTQIACKRIHSKKCGKIYFLLFCHNNF